MKDNDYSALDRAYIFDKLLMTDIQGTRNDQRLGRQIFLHGIRFTLEMFTEIQSQRDSWTNVHIHCAVVQALDDEVGPSNQKPTFSTPIGDHANDIENVVPIDNSSIIAADVRYGKLKNDEWKVITHRKYFLGKLSQLGNEQIVNTKQFYLPIKKSIQFDNASDQYGTKPFYIMIYFTPTNNYKEPAIDGDREIKVKARHSCFFKTTL